jgi:hypothetical protein
MRQFGACNMTASGNHLSYAAAAASNVYVDRLNRGGKRYVDSAAVVWLIPQDQAPIAARPLSLIIVDVENPRGIQWPWQACPTRRG